MSFAASLDVGGRQVLVCGGGPAALAPVRALLEAGARVVLVSPEVSATLTDLAARGLLAVRHRAYEPADLAAVALVVPASGDRDRDGQVARDAADRGVLTVSVDATVSITGDEQEPNAGAGEVVLVGGGPGDPGLLTLAGLDAVRTADVIVTDRLAPLSVLAHARPGAEIIDVAKIPRGAHTSQDRINELLVHHASAGRRVVRLKGGDNFVFGRGGEEWQACAAAGLPVRVIPGVSSAIAGPALAGVPLTHRQLTQGFTVVSGHVAPGDPASSLDWAALARTNTTLVILMGLATLSAITAELIRSGLAGDTPALTVADAGLASQRTVRGTVADIAERSSEAGLKPPAITVIGAVAAFTPTD